LGINPGAAKELHKAGESPALCFMDNMKRNLAFALVLAVIACGAYGCALINKPIEFAGDIINTTFSSSYSGPKAKIIIADFEVMTPKATTEISSNLRDLLTAEILKSQRFQIVSLPKDDAEKPRGLIIATKLLDFEPYSSGGKSGIGGGGSAASGALGSLLGKGFNKAYITLNIRIVDLRTSKVLFSERVSGQATGDYLREKGRKRDNSLGQALAIYAGTSMEEAINKSILEAVKYIIQKVPAEYYRGGEEDGKT
jgi:curli biogenesis system outer membrane secretion channel CsgG